MESQKTNIQSPENLPDHPFVHEMKQTLGINNLTSEVTL
jgi:hypothetical protein